MLEQMIREQIKTKPILLMTHMVLGFPSFEDNLATIEAMHKAGVELIELQIPFTEPVADGPVILKANCESIERGTKIADCLAFAEKVTSRFPEIAFLFMTYYNIVFTNGETEFMIKAKRAGIKGFIIPDLPAEEAGGWLSECEKAGVENIFIFTPMNTDARMKTISGYANGFVYCVGRKGVTGKKTEFDDSIDAQIKRYRQSTSLPIALGFGVRSKEDVEYLKGKVEIAVIGSKLIDVQLEKGAQGVERFLKEVR